MPDPSCPGCRELQGRVLELEEQVRGLQALVRELLAKLKTDATNSGTPPSANPLCADKPVQKQKSKLKRGGQPDHPPHLKQLLPAERVTRTKHLVPQECASCHAELPREAGPDDPEPKRFQ